MALNITINKTAVAASYPAGSTVATAVASGGTTPYTYSIATGGDCFSIDASTGVVTTKALMDVSSIQSFSVTVTDSNSTPESITSEVVYHSIQAAQQSKFNKSNVIYKIVNNIDLGNAVLTIPANCTLDFQGGSFSNGIIVFNNTVLINYEFDSTIIPEGKVVMEYINIKRFGAKGNNIQDDAPIFERCFNLCVASKCNLYIPEGTYLFATPVSMSGPYQDVNDVIDPSLFRDFNYITIYGSGRNTVIRGLSELGQDLFNIAFSRNITIRDMSLTTVVTTTTPDGTNGSNCISLVDNVNIIIQNVFCFDGAYDTNADINALIGGKGITIQSAIADNIQILDCECYNCAYGFDITAAYSLQFYDRNESRIYLRGCKADKCYRGLVVTGGGTKLNDNFVIKNGLICAEVRISDCFQPFVTQSCIGADINLQIVNKESLSQLYLNGSGIAWDNNKFTTVSSYMSSVCILNTIIGSNITINAYQKEANFILHLIGGQASIDPIYSKSSNITLLVNDNLNIVPYIKASSITNERKIYYSSGSTQGLKDMYINLKGFIDDYESTLNLNDTDMVGFLARKENKSIIIIDGHIYASGVYSDSITLKDTSSTGKSGLPILSSLITDGNYIGVKQKVASSGNTTVFYASNTNNNKVFAINNDGSLKLNVINSAHLVGGKGLVIYDMDNNIAGYLQIPSNITKGITTERPILTNVDTGFQYYDTTLNKYICWSGTTWTNLDGTALT